MNQRGNFSQLDQVCIKQTIGKCLWCPSANLLLFFTLNPWCTGPCAQNASSVSHHGIPHQHSSSIPLSSILILIRLFFSPLLSSSLYSAPHHSCFPCISTITKSIQVNNGLTLISLLSVASFSSPLPFNVALKHCPPPVHTPLQSPSFGASSGHLRTGLRLLFQSPSFGGHFSAPAHWTRATHLVTRFYNSLAIRLNFFKWV